jgi:hypothetical protein
VGIGADRAEPFAALVAVAGIGFPAEHDMSPEEQEQYLEVARLCQYNPIVFGYVRLL